MDKKEDARYEKILVECHSGYKVDEYPVAFTFQGKRLVVSEITDRWYEGGADPERPVIDYFKIKTSEGKVLILMHARSLDEWFVRYP